MDASKQRDNHMEHWVWPALASKYRKKAYISEEPPESSLFKLSLESLQLFNMP